MPGVLVRSPPSVAVRPTDRPVSRDEVVFTTECSGQG